MNEHEQFLPVKKLKYPGEDQWNIQIARRKLLFWRVYGIGLTVITLLTFLYAVHH